VVRWDGKPLGDGYGGNGIATLRHHENTYKATCLNSTWHAHDAPVDLRSIKVSCGLIGGFVGQSLPLDYSKPDADGWVVRIAPIHSETNFVVEKRSAEGYYLEDYLIVSVESSKDIEDKDKVSRRTNGLYDAGEGDLAALFGSGSDSSNSLVRISDRSQCRVKSIGCGYFRATAKHTENQRVRII
jgi:hypothetical protein